MLVFECQMSADSSGDTGPEQMDILPPPQTPRQAAIANDKLVGVP